MPKRTKRILNNYAIIAFEFPPYRGGIASYSDGLAGYLHRVGHEVEVITMNPKSSSELFRVIKPVPRPSFRWLIVRKGLSMCYRTYQYVFLFYTVLSIAITRRKNVILTSLFFDLSFISIKIFSSLNIPYTIVIHGKDVYELRRSKRTSFTRVIHGAAEIFVNSDHTKGILRRYFPESLERVRIHRPRLDTKWVDGLRLMTDRQIEEKYGIPSNVRLALTVCRLVQRKGVQNAIKAMHEVFGKGGNWLYLIAGEGDYEVELRATAAGDPRIRFLKAISEEEKFSLLRRATLFLMPNLEISELDVEGFGIVFLEAAYMKNWVIGGRNGGVPEAVDESSNGFLIDSHSDQISQIVKIVESLDHEVHGLQALKRGRQYVLENHSF